MIIFPRPPYSRILELLAECKLPCSDLSESNLEYFLGCGTEASPDGVIGLEIHGKDGLLRSLAVTTKSRGLGYGKALVSRMEKYAQAKGVRHLYLLTEDAVAFFTGLGYSEIDRARVSNEIRKTKEFSSLCPDDAVVMRKALETEVDNCQSNAI